jgi:hypothetical protein
MWKMMENREPMQIENPHLIKTKNLEKQNLLKSIRDERIELGSIPVNIRDYENTRVKLVINSALKSITPKDIRAMQRANQRMDESEMRPLEQFKQFDDQDRDYWLTNYKVDTTNINVFQQIHSCFNSSNDNDYFYFSAEIR